MFVLYTGDVLWRFTLLSWSGMAALVAFWVTSNRSVVLGLTERDAIVVVDDSDDAATEVDEAEHRDRVEESDVDPAG